MKHKREVIIKENVKDKGYESWNIEDFINISNSNKENKSDKQEINRSTDEVESVEGDDIQDRVEPVNNQNESRVQRENNSRGRPRGLSRKPQTKKRISKRT